MSTQYNADAIEVLNGLEPVRRRPGMYTDTTRPNHLGQEVIDNSVDEALAGHARNLEVILHEDQSLEVIDDGRGMPETPSSGWMSTGMPRPSTRRWRVTPAIWR